MAEKTRLESGVISNFQDLATLTMSLERIMSTGSSTTAGLLPTNKFFITSIRRIDLIITIMPSIHGPVYFN